MGYCPTSEQDRLNVYASLIAATFPLSAGIINYGNSTPLPDYQSFPWIRLNPDGTLDGTYAYANGSWTRPHPVPANSPILFAWNDVAANIATFDGGEVASVSSNTGPMWQISTVDSLPPAADGSNVIAWGEMLIGQSTTYAQGSEGGVAQVTLDLTQIPPHVHPPLAGSGTAFATRGAATGSSLQGSGDSNFCATTGTAGGLTATTTAPHNNLPPYKAVYFISRTARQFYRV